MEVVCTMLLCSAGYPCAPVRHQAALMQERSPSLPPPDLFCFTDLGSAANERLRLQQEFTKAGRWVTGNMHSWDSLVCVRAALLKALC